MSDRVLQIETQKAHWRNNQVSAQAQVQAQIVQQVQEQQVQAAAVGSNVEQNPNANPDTSMTPLGTPAQSPMDGGLVSMGKESDPHHMSVSDDAPKSLKKNSYVFGRGRWTA